MKSFLYRVAASVVRPRPSLHPFVESIYSTATIRQSNDPQLQFETEIAPRPVNHVAEGTQPSLPRAEDDHSEASPFAHPASFSRHPANAVRDAFQALLPTSQTESTNFESLSSKSKLNSDSAASLSEHSHSSSHQVRLSPALGFSPIVRQAVPQADHPSAIKPTQPPTLGEIQAVLTRPSASRQSTNLPPAPRSALQQPDDIQIHIGRIEVTAVSPPASRPAAAPASKGVSLDEYLSRRNGRLG